MADYDKFTWVENQTQTGPTRMNALETAVDDASKHHKRGNLSARPAAATANKNWFYNAIDKGISYLSDGAAWNEWIVGKLALVATRFGVGGSLISPAADDVVFSVNYDNDIDRSIDNTKPSYLYKIGTGASDRITVMHAPPTVTSVSPTWTTIYTLGNTGAGVGGGPPLVTSLPTTGPGGGALQDGQECIFLADPAKGIAWNLKYRIDQLLQGTDDFESGVTGWATGAPLLNAGGTISSVADGSAPKGAKVGEIVTTGAAVLQGAYCYADLVAGTKYTMRLTLKRQAGTGTIWVGVMRATTPFTKYTLVAASTVGAYTEYVGTFTPDFTGSHVLFIAVNEAIATTIRIDKAWVAAGDTIPYSPPPWLVIGGPPLHEYVDTVQATNSTNYVDLTTPGPSLTIPVNGDYIMEMAGLAVNQTVNANRGFLTPKKNAVATADADGTEAAMPASNGYTTTLFRRRRMTGLTAGDVYKLQSAVASANNVGFGNRSLSLIPVRLG